MYTSDFLYKRLELGKNYLNGVCDPNLDYIPFFNSNLTGDGYPYYEHDKWDLCDVGWRLVESSLIYRKVFNKDITSLEEKLRDVVFSSIREDGLSYRNEAEWSNPEAWMWDQGRALITLMSMVELDDNREWAKEKALNMLKALENIAIKKDNYLIFPAENWKGNCWGTDIFGHPPIGLQIEGAVRYYNFTKDEWAKDFAIKVAETQLAQDPPLLYDSGKMYPCGGGKDLPYTHVHSRLFILYGFYLLGESVGIKKYSDYAIKGFKYILDNHSLSFGWVLECMERIEHGKLALNEICCAMDVVKFALAMAKKEPIWYDVVEKFVFNAISAHQITDFTRIIEHIDFDNKPENTKRRNYDDIVTRFIGSITGSYQGNEVFRSEADENATCPIIVPSGCCSPAGLTCMGLAILNSVSETDTEVVINMAIPFKGRNIDVKTARIDRCEYLIFIKNNIDVLKIRLADWIDKKTIKVSCPYIIEDNYIIISNPKDTICVNGPTFRYNVKEPWCGGDLVSKWEGNICVDLISDFDIKIPMFPL